MSKAIRNRQWWPIYDISLPHEYRCLLHIKPRPRSSTTYVVLGIDKKYVSASCYQQALFGCRGCFGDCCYSEDTS